jgi:hypothetical protein
MTSARSGGGPSLFAGRVFQPVVSRTAEHQVTAGGCVEGDCREAAGEIGRGRGLEVEEGSVIVVGDLPEFGPLIDAWYASRSRTDKPDRWRRRMGAGQRLRRAGVARRHWSSKGT